MSCCNDAARFGGQLASGVCGCGLQLVLPRGACRGCCAALHSEPSHGLCATTGALVQSAAFQPRKPPTSSPAACASPHPPRPPCSHTPTACVSSSTPPWWTSSWPPWQPTVTPWAALKAASTSKAGPRQAGGRGLGWPAPFHLARDIEASLCSRNLTCTTGGARHPSTLQELSTPRSSTPWALPSAGSTSRSPPRSSSPPRCPLPLPIPHLTPPRRAPPLCGTRWTPRAAPACCPATPPMPRCSGWRRARRRWAASSPARTTRAWRPSSRPCSTAPWGEARGEGAGGGVRRGKGGLRTGAAPAGTSVAASPARPMTLAQCGRPWLLLAQL